jgi:predicted Zn-dependent peptidase
MVFEGSKKYQNPLARTMRAGLIGLDINASTSPYRVTFPITGAKAPFILQPHFLEAFDTVADCISHPLLDSVAVEKQRAIIQREREERESQNRQDPPLKSIGEEMMKRLYGNNLSLFNPPPVIGTRQTIDRITAEALRDHHSRFFVGENIVVSVGGDLNGNLLREIERKVGAIPRGTRALLPSFLPERQYHGTEVVEFLAPVQVTDVQIHFQTYGEFSGDRNSVALSALSYMLGGSPQSLLFQDLRERRRLVYSVSCGETGHEKTGLMRISYSVEPAQLEESLQAVEQNINALKRGDFPEQMIDAWKAAYLPRAIWDFRQPGWVYQQLANKCMQERAGHEWHGFKGLRQFLSLTKQDVVDAANKYLTENRIIFIVKPNGSDGIPAQEQGHHLYSLG